jgi:peptidoglycan hydrolase CwlO-like protein
MLIAYFILFIALCPGVLFTIPALGKKMGGKVITAVMHAVLFVIVVNLLDVYEKFQSGQSNPPKTVSEARMNLKQIRTNYSSIKEKLTNLEWRKEIIPINIQEKKNELAEIEAQIEADAQIRIDSAKGETNAFINELQNEIVSVNAEIPLLTSNLKTAEQQVKDAEIQLDTLLKQGPPKAGSKKTTGVTGGVKTK